MRETHGGKVVSTRALVVEDEFMIGLDVSQTPDS
jgi:hypothetical protein